MMFGCGVIKWLGSDLFLVRGMSRYLGKGLVLMVDVL